MLQSKQQLKIMKKISLILLMAGIGFTAQPVHAQDNDTSKNKIEVKKKIKVGAHGRQVTKIKVEGKGTPEAINSAATTAVTGKTHVVVAPAPAVAPAATPVVIINQHPEPKPAATTVTTTTETKPVIATSKTTTSSVKTSTSHVVSKKPVTTHVYHKVYHKPDVAASSKTTTTTTVKKEQ
jgi:hypothetical protein